MISHYCGQDMAGIYGVACTLALVLNFVLNAINDAYVPWLYQKLKIGEAADSPRIANIIAVIMAVLLLGVIVLAPELIFILAGEPYAQAVWAVGPVAMSVLLLFYAQLFINIQFYYEEKVLLVVASLGAAVLNVLLNALLIPKLGFLIAAYTTLASYVVFVWANYAVMRRVLKKRELTLRLFDEKSLLLILAAFLMLSFGAMLLYPYPVVRFVLAAAALGILAWNSKRILKLLRLIRREGV